MKYKSIFYLLIFSLFLLNCKTLEERTIKQSNLLSKKEFYIIKNDKEITENLYLTIIDSIDLYKIKKPLNNYFESNNKRELLSILEVYRVFGNKTIDIDVLPKDSIDQSKMLKIDSVDDLKELKQKLQGKLNIKTVIDSTKN